MRNLQLTICGYLVGNIWMSNAECSKPFNYDVTREAKRYVGGKPTLRDHVLAATNDGDFQSCLIAAGGLIATVTKRTKTGSIKRTRCFDLSQFHSIADCLRNDWDGPYEDE